MAVTVTNTNQINFGTITSNQTITHLRVQKTDGTFPITTALGSTINAQASNALIVNAGDIDLIHEEGAFPQNYYENLVQSFWGVAGTTSMQVDLLTSSTAVVSDSGYRQQTVNQWTINKT